MADNISDHIRKREWAARYSRQMLVPQFGGIDGQQGLASSSVVVVGAGGIGSTVILYLAGAGVGQIDIVDFDVVEESNLHRQIIHSTESAHNRTLKAQSAHDRLKALNPCIKCSAIDMKLTSENASELVRAYDIVVDATDNSPARYALNDACALHRKTLVSGSAVGMEGQITVFPYDGTHSCYRCLYPSPSSAEGCRSCANAGVVGPVPGVIGTLQAMEVIKILTSPSSLLPSPHNTAYVDVKSAGLSALVGRQVYYDATCGEFHTFSLPPRKPSCPTCGSSPPQLPDTPTLPAVTSDFHSLLGSDKRISASVYAQDVLRASVPHLLLDVRPAMQFRMINIHSSDVFSTAEVDEKAKVTVLNVPYTHISSIDEAEATEALEQICNAVKRSSCGGSTLPVYVLCRRGNDSVRTALKLQDICDDITVFNINGGLHAWSKEVDHCFPAY